MVLKIVDSFKMLRVISTTLNLMFYLTLTIYYRGDAAPVTNINQAMKYLSRFGYLDPGYQNSLQNSSYSSILSIKTIKDFQSFGGLKITGELDAETLKLMNTPRCEVPDRVRPNFSNRTKRFVTQGSRWPKKQLTYKISKYTTKMSKSDVDREIARAFQMWADVTELTFVHQNNESDKADIDILFVTGEHGSCPSFNNYLGDDVYAHATYPENGGDAHFDEDQPWTINSDKGKNLFQIATHEFGHSLGLDHSNLKTAVMYPVYTYSSDFKLDKDDIEGIQELYGENLLRKLTMEFKDSITALKEEWMEAKNKLETELKETRRELDKTRAGLSKTVDNLSEKLNDRTSVIVDIGKMPTSCFDLERMGHKLSGFFSVKGSKKMEMIYCDFNPNINITDKQKWIGYTDVKSAPVHFYVQRNSSFDTTGTPIPFDLARVNDGNAMNLTSGIFTAPRPGIYFFSFTGLAQYPKSESVVSLEVILYLNGEQIGMGWVEEPNSVAGQRSPLTLHSTLNLKKGDRVWVAIWGKSAEVNLYDSLSHHTHFTGWMLEEDVSSEIDPLESLPVTEPVTQPSAPMEPEATTEAEVITTTEAIPETTTIPMGQCRLPVQPADDPDVDDNSGTRFGNVKFSRHEYNTLPSLQRPKAELSVEFKTSEPDGIIYYAANVNDDFEYTALYLKDGKLHFSFNCGTGPALLSSPETYNDDQWHTVMFNRDRQNGTLVVDDLVVAEGSSPGNAQSINVDRLHHYVGGISPEVLNNARHNFKGVEGGFIGCLRNFWVSSRPAGEPSYIEGTEPCSPKVETGSFFAVQGGYIKAVEYFHVGLDIDISMEIKPRSTSGILMSVHGRRDFLLLQMVNGALIFSVDNGRGPIVATYIPPHEHHMCDGKWHYVQAIKAKAVVTLSVDNVFVEPGIGAADVSSTNTNNPLFIGGHPDPSKPRGIKTQEQFVGCIRNLNINRNLLRFGSTQAIGSVTTTTCPTI